MLGAHLCDHGPLGQGHKTNGQRARVPVVVLPNATPKQVFEAIKGEVRVVNKDDEVVVEPSGGAAGVDVVVGRHVLLVADDVHVGGVEHLRASERRRFGPGHTVGSFRFGRCGRERRFRGDPRVRLLGNVRVKLACW